MTSSACASRGGIGLHPPLWGWTHEPARCATELLPRYRTAILVMSVMRRPLRANRHALPPHSDTCRSPLPIPRFGTAPASHPSLSERRRRPSCRRPVTRQERGIRHTLIHTKQQSITLTRPLRKPLHIYLPQRPRPRTLNSAPATS